MVARGDNNTMRRTMTVPVWRDGSVPPELRGDYEDWRSARFTDAANRAGWYDRQVDWWRHDAAKQLADDLKLFWLREFMAEEIDRCQPSRDGGDDADYTWGSPSYRRRLSWQTNYGEIWIR